MNFHEAYEYFWKIFLFLSHIDFSFQKFFLWISMKFMNIFERLSFFRVWSLENFSSTYRTSQLFRLFGLFKSYEFVSEILYFSSFEKAPIDNSNLSISFIPNEFMIFSIKRRFLNFTVLFEKFKCLNFFKSYEFFREILYFSSFEKAPIDNTNLSISFIPNEFVIFSVKIRFLNFTMLLEKFKYLNFFKSYEFFSEILYFSSFEKAPNDNSNLSISFIPNEFVIFSIKTRFLNFTMLFERFKYLNFFKSYEFFSKCLHFREMDVFITKNKIFVKIFSQSLWCALKVEVFKSVQEFN